jgi:hypothetical protein
VAKVVSRYYQTIYGNWSAAEAKKVVDDPTYMYLEKLPIYVNAFF